MNKINILEKLNLKDPYNYIASLNIAGEISPDWGGKSKIFEELILESTPKLILELGCFLGDSTITMANVLKKQNIEGVILTVDTWLGSQEHWLKNKCDLLHLYDNFENGISSLYNKCLRNIINAQVADYIVPVPTTTSTAFDIFLDLDFKFDMIYMDADHTKSVVYDDLNKYYKLLAKNGIIFGHDIDWIGVNEAVKQFCTENNLFYDVYKDNDGVDKFWRIL